MAGRPGLAGRLLLATLGLAKGLWHPLLIKALKDFVEAFVEMWDVLGSKGRMKIECGSSSTQFLSDAMFVDTSRTSTTITCSSAGCTVELETPLTDWCEGVALAGLGSTLSFTLLVSQILHWLSIA
ncbi:Gstt1 [Symbiodinium sp. CCMP2592]|nr:Gstt1 [Symbiodinium sp. CCMP2592]